MSEVLLSRNLQRWATYCPTGAKLLSTHQRTEGKFQEETLEEAEKWFKKIELYNVSTLFVFGVGSGKYYRAAKDWLLENREREIVFLEDDLEVISRLLETELGKELIFDNQAWLQHIQWVGKEEEPRKPDSLASIPFFLFLGDIQISAIPSYVATKGKEYSHLSHHLHYLKNIKLWLLTEHIHLGKGFFKNFYRNLVGLPKARLADSLFKKFEGVPAIICGAGPSLDKNRALLETLKDRALIFGGGSAMNVLNETGFNPHFGVGIDPNWAQYARLTMNQAFAVPYFYRARMYSEALESIPGEHLFVRGAAGYDISTWAEEKLGLSGENVSEGNNVVNFSLSLAHALGCSPIILVGVDLAYSNLTNYSKGVLGHPLYDFNMNLSTKALSEELLVKKDINGKDTFTLWKWVMESIWYTEYGLKHPETNLINATEGGIGFDHIPNIPLAEVADKYLSSKYDFDTWIHGEIQNAKMPEKVNEQSIIGVLQELQVSLEKCETYCTTLRNEFNEMIKLNQMGKDLPSNMFTDVINENIEKLHQEIAYTHLLVQFNDSFSAFAGKSFEEIVVEELNEQDLVQAKVRKITINKRRYEFLASVCKYNRYEIGTIVEEYAIRKAVSEMPGAKISAPQTIPTFDQPKGEIKELFYPDGKMKMRRGIKNGEFDGPSLFYSPEGKILAHSHYGAGKKEGATWLFYDSGEVFSVQNFAEGRWEGKQEFFYKNGVRKTLLNYHNGQLDGEVLLYHLNGKLYRQLRFKEGKRDGKESLWNMGGFIEFEAEYKDNRAIGACRAWYPNGKIAREVLYDNDSNAYSIRQWNADGTLLPEEAVRREDYFDVIAKQTTALTNSLQNLYKELEKISTSIPEKTLGLNLKEGIEDIKLKMEMLHKLEKKMNNKEDQQGQESIWKTPAARRVMGKQLEATTRKMAEEIALMQDALKIVSDLVKKNEQETNKENKS